MTFIIGTPHTHGAGHLDAHSGGHNSTHERADIQCCPHCQAAIKMQEWKLESNWCRLCSAPICNGCAERMATEGCVPYLKKIEMALSRDHQRSQYRKLLGL